MSRNNEDQIKRRLEMLSQVEPSSDATQRAIERARVAFTWGKATTSYKIKSPGPIIKFAAAAVLLICAGFFASRLFAPKSIDAEQLRSEIESSLKSSFAANCEQIKDELHQQVRRDLVEFAAQTVAASRTVTERRLMELVQLIEQARVRDRYRVASALEQIELNRLKDKKQIGNNLQTLAYQTSELLSTE